MQKVMYNVIGFVNYSVTGFVITFVMQKVMYNVIGFVIGLTFAFTKYNIVFIY